MISDDDVTAQAIPTGKPEAYGITCPRCGRQFTMKITALGLEYCGCGHLKDVVFNGVVVGIFRK